MTNATKTAPAKPKRQLEWIKLVEIVADLQIQQRDDWNVSDHRVQEYADIIGSPDYDKLPQAEKFPPIVVYEDADKTTWLSDGFTRYFAHDKAGKKKILCEVRKGTRDDALWNACSANKTHGWRRSNKDKQRAVVSALKHPNSTKLSDRAIADHCGCSNTMVSELRKQLASEGEIETSDARVNKSGGKVNTNADTTAKKSAAGKKGAAAKAPAKPKPAPVVSKSDITEGEEGFDVEGGTALAKPAAAPVAKATAPVNDGKVLDADGTEITDEKLKSVFRKIDDFHLIARGLRMVAAKYESLIKHDAGCFLGEYDGTVLLELAAVVEASTPKKLNKKYSNGWEPTNISKVDRNKDFKDGE